MGTDANAKKKEQCILIKALHKYYLLMHTWCMAEVNTDNVHSPHDTHGINSSLFTRVNMEI